VHREARARRGLGNSRTHEPGADDAYLSEGGHDRASLFEPVPPIGGDCAIIPAVLRRPLVVGAVAGAALTVAGAARAQAPAPLGQLPRGGRELFPAFRVIAYTGRPRAPGLGALGAGSPAQAVLRLRAQARAYARVSRPALPALELIATLATRTPGRGQLYRAHLPDAVIARYLLAARAARALLVLEIQPGRSTFPAEVRRLARWLREPDVGVALDPEWRLGPRQVPRAGAGSVGAEEVNAVSRELARIVDRHSLPEKLLVLHDFTGHMVRDASQIVERPEVATVVDVDAIGDRRSKAARYRAIAALFSPFAYFGIKLFYDKDHGLMAPSSVLALQPRPDVVIYG